MLLTPCGKQAVVVVVTAPGEPGLMYTARLSGAGQPVTLAFTVVLTALAAAAATMVGPFCEPVMLHPVVGAKVQVMGRLPILAPAALM